jgi:predicted DNA-binding transcriptional regulator YafY
MSVQGPHGGYGIIDTYKLFVDFSMLTGTNRQPELFRTIEQAVDDNRLLRINYTNNKLESTERVVEPMTLVFKWRSWYLFAYCHFKNDYRLFRLSRIRDPSILPQRFRRRDKPVEEYLAQTDSWNWGKTVGLVLAFDPKIRSLVEEHFAGERSEEDERGRLIIHATMPKDGWVYGMILSYGNLVEVLFPDRLRKIVSNIATEIHEKYQKS